LPAFSLLAQQPRYVVLDVEIENAVRYFADVTDPGKLAVNASPTAPSPTKAFTDTIFVGDIVAINGKRVKGLWTSRQYVMGFSPTPAPGSAIADVTQGAIAECKYEILNADGVFIGRMMDGGLSPHAVSAGTGAFLGVRGEQISVAARVVKAVRTASMAEDPASRRVNGGGNVRFLLNLVPLFRPEVLTAAGGLAIVHGDSFQPVTAANPAKAGEILTLYASDLGPTTPAVNADQPFPQTTTPSTVNAPVDVMINGQTSEVLYAGGYPGAVNAYQVNFRLPAAVASGTAALQIVAAWIPGSEVKIAIR
jgi:uncharacterized protein (TIGR03437 family)